MNIQELGKEARRLADQGGKLNQGEANLFYNSLMFGDLHRCKCILKTLETRIKLDKLQGDGKVFSKS